MKEIRYIDNRRNMAGFPKGEDLAEKFYEKIINDIADDFENTNFILEFTDATLVAMSVVEGFAYVIGEKKNGDQILENTTVIASQRIKNRFSKYVGKKGDIDVREDSNNC